MVSLGKEFQVSIILVVEDDRCLSQEIGDLLKQQGMMVKKASGYQEALQWVLNREQIDLYLVDVMLPDGDGFSLCEKIRERDTNPILFLTACSDEESVVRGLESGADDYIVKPFRVRELLSRIQANLRREEMRQGRYLYSGDLYLDKEEALVYRQGESLKLSKLEYRLLEYMMNHPGIVLKREQILENIWDGEGRFVEDNTLSVSISRLRRKVGIYQDKPYWEVVWGVGYRYLLPVRISAVREW